MITVELCEQQASLSVLKDLLSSDVIDNLFLSAGSGGRGSTFVEDEVSSDGLVFLPLAGEAQQGTVKQVLVALGLVEGLI